MYLFLFHQLLPKFGNQTTITNYKLMTCIPRPKLYVISLIYNDMMLGENTIKSHKILKLTRQIFKEL